MDWNLEELKKRLSGKPFGHQIHYYSQADSTNDKAFALGIAGAPEGTVVIADRQSRGKGRLQRSWYSPPDVNIYTSLVLRPRIASSEAARIPLMAGIAVAEVLAAYCPGKIKLKWPNDILLNNKKVCGILSQAKIAGNEIDFIVLGIGINVNIAHHELPLEICDSATSMIMETGREISRQDLIISLYENLEKWYKQLLQKGFIRIRQKWLELTPMIGQNVQVIFKDETIEGKATGIDDEGSLIILAEGNKEIIVSAGDATILKR